MVQPGAANADYPFYYHFFFIRSLVCDDRVRCYSADNSQSSHKKIKNKIEKRVFFFFFEAIMSNDGLCVLSLKREYFALELILTQQTVLPFAIDPRLASFLFIIIIFLILILINYLSLLILSYPSIYFSRPSL